MKLVEKMQPRKVTLYLSGEMFGNFTKIEASAYAVEVAPYAQYTNAVHVVFKKKGARTPRGTVQSYKPSLVILDGWGHFDPPSMFTAPEKSSPGVMVQKSRYSSFDPRWASDFAAVLKEHVEKTGATVLHDFREHATEQRRYGT